MNFKWIYISIFFSALVFSSESYPQNFPAGYEDALKLFQQKNYQGSLAVIRSNFNPASHSYEFRMLAAANYLNLGNYELAKQHLVSCKTEHPKRYEPIAFTGVILRKSGNLYGAANEIIQGIAKFPDNSGLRLEMTRIYFLLEKLPEARSQLDVVLQKDPNNINAIYLDGLIFIKQARYEEAEFRLKNVMGMKELPASIAPSLHNNLGLSLERMGLVIQQKGDKVQAKAKFQEALENYNKALGYSPDHPIYNRNKARISGML
jgi:tetratricopeptide (TPR) repeat protein